MVFLSANEDVYFGTPFRDILISHRQKNFGPLELSHRALRFRLQIQHTISVVASDECCPSN